VLREDRDGVVFVGAEADIIFRFSLSFRFDGRVVGRVCVSLFSCRWMILWEYYMDSEVPAIRKNTRLVGCDRSI
jgi:hypothetical protein